MTGQIAMNFHVDLGARDRRFRLQVDTSIPGSGITAVYGASGSGKTTLLRCLAGMQKAQGSLTVQGECWQQGKQMLPTHQRPIGYVFQEASLFTHLNVRGNLDYARKRAAPGKLPLDFDALLDLLGIAHLLEQSTDSLSGGERQRVAIARALLINPSLLLMDEPLAALDSARKREILPYLERLHQSLSIPIVYVTHSLEEVARLADHILVLEDGVITEQGPAMAVLSRLQSSLQDEEGSGAVLEVEVAEKDARWQLAKVTFPGGFLWLRDNGEALGARMRLRVSARDVSLSLSDNQDSSIVNRLPCTVTEIIEEADEAMALVGLKLGGLKPGASKVIARVTRRSLHDLNLCPGMPVWAQIKSVAILH